jgi:hypothetical protein
MNELAENSYSKYFIKFPLNTKALTSVRKSEILLCKVSKMALFLDWMKIALKQF